MNIIPPSPDPTSMILEESIRRLEKAQDDIELLLLTYCRALCSAGAHVEFCNRICRDYDIDRTKTFDEKLPTD